MKSAFPNIIIAERPKLTSTSEPLDPNWVTGFSEGDSTFITSINSKTNLVRIRHSIGLHIRDTPLINRIKAFYGTGNIYTDNVKVVSFAIDNMGILSSKVVTHFKNYPLQGNKLPNFLIWCEILEIVIAGNHRTPTGLSTIIGLRSKLNKW